MKLKHQYPLDYAHSSLFNQQLWSHTKRHEGMALKRQVTSMVASKALTTQKNAFPTLDNYIVQKNINTLSEQNIDHQR